VLIYIVEGAQARDLCQEIDFSDVSLVASERVVASRQIEVAGHLWNRLESTF
jgi:hypothetical protein